MEEEEKAEEKEEILNEQQPYSYFSEGSLGIE